jgi:hypothetical protein
MKHDAVCVALYEFPELIHEKKVQPMIQNISTPSADIVAFEAKGDLTKEDYTGTILPIIQKSRSEGKKLKFLFHLGAEFTGFTPEAAWEDFKLGLQHMNTFERIAVVSDKGWIRNASRIFGSLMPCEVHVFKNNELSSAISWLDSGEIGLNHKIDESRGVLIVEISHPLTSDNFSIMAHTVDRWIENKGSLNGIVIHAKTFPGWENLGSLFSHIDFVKNHHRKVRKVALVVDGALAVLAPHLASHFVAAEIKHFSYENLDAAIDWAGGTSGNP